MHDPRLENHVVGVELQIVELVQRRDQALARGQRAEAAGMQHELDDLYAELADTAEAIAAS